MVHVAAWVMGSNVGLSSTFGLIAFMSHEGVNE